MELEVDDEVQGGRASVGLTAPAVAAGAVRGSTAARREWSQDPDPLEA
jgi:hypothetical protein